MLTDSNFYSYTHQCVRFISRLTSMGSSIHVVCCSNKTTLTPPLGSLLQLILVRISTVMVTELQTFCFKNLGICTDIIFCNGTTKLCFNTRPLAPHSRHAGLPAPKEVTSLNTDRNYSAAVRGQHV